VAGYTQLLLLALGQSLRQASSGVHVAVVFGGGEDGASAKLTLRVQPDGPAGLYPDPRRMAFFRADGEFAASLAEAWATSPLAIRSKCVLWEIADDEMPVERVSGGSLAAAFGVGLSELSRSARRLRRLTPQHLDPRCAITGGLDRNGILLPVGEYEPKLLAASRKGWRMVVPESDPEAAKHPDIKVKVDFAADIRSAIRHSRRLRPRPLIATAAVLVIGLGGLIAVHRYQEQASQAGMRATAARVASEASQVFDGDEPTGLLLAMASDSIAASAGERTSIFSDLVENGASLVKIDRPDQGAYHDAVLSPDGSLALLGNSGGEIDLVSTLNGERLWSRVYPPNLILAPGQVTITAMAISNDGQQAAYASSDGLVHLLRQQQVAQGKPRWREQWSAPGPWKAAETSIGASMGGKNAPSQLSFTPDGRQLFASDGNTIAVYATAGPGHLSRVCPGSGGGQEKALASFADLTATGPGQALLTLGQAVYQGRLGSCRFTRLFTLPSEVTLNEAYLSSAASGGARTVHAIGTSGNSVVRYQQGSKPVTLATFSDVNTVQLTPTASGGAVVTISSSDGTFGLDAVTGRHIFDFRGTGSAVATDDIGVFLHDGEADIHSWGTGAIGQATNYYAPAIRMLSWAGNGALVAAMTNGIEVFRDPVSPPATPGGPETGAMLPGTIGSEAYALATSSSGPLAAAVLSVGNNLPGNPTKVSAWDIALGRLLPVPSGAAGDRANAVAFLGATLLVGYRSGLICALTLGNGQWTVSARTTISGSPVSMSAGPSGDLYVLTAVGSAGHAVLQELGVSASGSFRAIRSRQLPGSFYGVVQALPSGVVVSNGTGSTADFTSALRPVHPAAAVDVGVPNGLAIIPDSDEVMVTGIRGFGVLRKSTLRELGSTAWQRAGDVTTATADPIGPYLATYSFFSMRLNIWAVAPHTLQQEACAAIGASLTRAQWAQYVGSTVPYRQVCPQLPASPRASVGASGVTTAGHPRSLPGRDRLPPVLPRPRAMPAPTRQAWPAPNAPRSPRRSRPATPHHAVRAR
jgi:WD40 repeat protein